MKNNGKVSALIRISALAVATMLVMSGCGKPVSTDSKAGTATATPAAAKTFVPDKPVTLIVPSSPGGAGDLVARTVEKVWSKYCPQTVLIVNKANAGGIEGSTFVARSKPDGYTLTAGYGSGWDLVSPHMSAPVEYDAFKDLMPIARITMQPVLIVVKKDSPLKNIKDLLDWAKKEKKPITAAVGTANSSQVIVMKALAKLNGVEITTIPHTGGGQAMTTLVGGNTVIGGANLAEIAAFYKDGRVRAIGIASEEREKLLPDVPTLKEQGIDIATAGVMKGLAAPIGTPKEIIDYYAELVKKICADEEFKKITVDILQPTNYLGPDEFGKAMRAEYDICGKLAKELDIGYKK